MMEGKGVYKWSNGARYKGEFEQNLMHGRGLLEWSSNCWYEGDFANGHRHGRGLFVNGEDHFMYTGQWCSGHRHGKGYCRFGDNGSYDGDWEMEKMSGVGLRIYPSGARYVGQWKDGLRHGIGTMIWTNGNVYRGEWKCGAMDGYGEYVWEGFFNKTFTWPQEASYTGDWRRGMRHGKGRLKLKSVGGAEYSGYWRDNKKHGQGIIIGNNGEKCEADPLFLNDILVSSDVANGTSRDQAEIEDKSTCVAKEIKPLFLEKPSQLGKAPVTPILKPEQFPSFSYYLTRLLDPKRLEPRSVPSVSSGKCYNCDNPSCSCLGPHTNGAIVSEEIINTETVDAFKSIWENEQRWLQNCLTLHISRLRQIYKDYAKLFAKSAPQCNLAMSRLCLWQLWQDCGINKKGLSLSEIDNYMAKNESAFVKDPCYPFEKIEIWQFLHALLEVSWHLYTKNDNIEDQEMHGKLAGGLHKFLKNDVYTHVGNHVGSFYHEYQNLLPLNCVFELYQSIGLPCSTKDFLRATCALKGDLINLYDIL
ncbi:radial spoke head 10 homolog B-like [Hylaeus volcanicus]|uniref:radial spoke head 10 homolog B-like n=1 Tax=Hylaeus volcanicus TaxID=313075 RepID=UPI0023B83916|nr:radial spoke head 10 homolog B-like [Hylaeus volcanicus]